MKQPTKSLAIIGCGPRGLSALESLFVTLSNEKIQTLLNVIVFEKAEALGCGSIYYSSQPDTNWLNISERALTIAKRPEIKINDFTISSFPSYHEWTGKTKDTILNNKHEIFPKRSEIGNYLHERYQSLAKKLKEKGWLKVIHQIVTQVEIVDSCFRLTTENNTTYKTDEVLLTIGHQDTKRSQQLQEFKAFSEENKKAILFLDTYPISNILKQDFKNTNQRVGIRGFGLAMIDLVRALCEANGGSFEIIDEETQQMRYHKDKAALQLIPFSLDGLPMASKPLNSKVDALFTPSDARLLAFESELKQTSNKPDYSNGNQFLIDAMATVAANQYAALQNKAYTHALDVNDLKQVISSYLNDQKFTHELILSNSNAPEVTIKSFIDMATAKAPISLDYCLGQVWRHCEPTLYKTMSHAELSDDIIKAVISLDERMKRYAFGPPIESLQQLHALALEGTLDLNFVNDPEITLTDAGWKLSKDEQEITVNMMVNSVLDSPELLKVSSPLITNLLEDNIIKPVHSDLGVKTKENGIVMSDNKRITVDLAVLGRLAKGSVVGVDAILECFGPRIKDWAEGAVDRVKNK